MLIINPHRDLITDGLAGWWLHGSEDGTDASGYGRHGTVSGSPAWTDMLGQRALNFDGTDDLISNCGTVSDFAFIHNTGVFSIAFNVNWYANNTRHFFGNTLTSVEKGFFCGREYIVDLGYNVMRILVFGGTANKYIVSGTTADNTAMAGVNDRWCFVANKAVNSYGQWYKNGTAVTTSIRVPVSQTAMAAVSGDASRTLRLGAANADSVVFQMKGYQSNLRIYNRALSAAEAIAITTGQG